MKGKNSNHHANKQYTEALSDFTQTIQLQPNNWRGHHNRGSTYLDLDCYEKALPDFTRAIQLQPNDGSHYFWRGCTYYELQRYQEALPDYSKADFSESDKWMSRNISCLIKLGWSEEETVARAKTMAEAIKASI